MSRKISKKKRKRRYQQKPMQAKEKKLHPTLPKAKGVTVSEYEITYEPIEDENYKRLPSKVKNRIKKLNYMVYRKPKQAIAPLKKLIKKYLNIPRLYNFLCAAYSRIGDEAKSVSIAKENYEKHPDYLFAKINYAEICLRNEDIEEIPIIFDNKFDLKMLYPRREKFHISEVINLMGVIGIYFCETDKRQGAETYYKILKQIAPRHLMTKRLKRKLYPSLLTRVLERFIEPPEKPV